MPRRELPLRAISMALLVGALLFVAWYVNYR
jgi:hypothetical protein